MQKRKAQEILSQWLGVLPEELENLQLTNVLPNAPFRINKGPQKHFKVGDLIDALTTPADFVIREQAAGTGKTVNIKVFEEEGGALAIRPEGYGDFYSDDGEGAPIILEFYENELRLVVFDDINSQDAGHTISMEEARENKRE